MLSAATANRISNAMRRTRQAQGYTQQEMAGRLKCSLSTVVNCERLDALPKSGAILAQFKNQVRQAVAKDKSLRPLLDELNGEDDF